MLNKLKSVFLKQQNPENSAHSKTDGPTCPFTGQNKSSGKCPVSKTQKTYNSSDESEDEEKPQGGCPFMKSAGKKKNPNLGIDAIGGYNEPFVSKYKYYLETRKVDLNALKKGQNQTTWERKKFDNYPIYLKHTIFFSGKDYKKIRSLECCSRFMVYDELRERGNRFYNKGKYEKALEIYERAMSIFRWLQFKEIQQEKPIKGLSQSASDAYSCSDFSEEEQMGSKIKLNLSEEQTENNDKELDDFCQKYKEFFVIYHDSNTVYHDGEEMVEKADIEMRNSLLLQIYLNMAAAYIHLNHYYLAESVLADAMKITCNVSQVYLRKSQVALFQNNSTVFQLKEALGWITRAIQMRPNEKIYQNTGINLLKMVNIHDAEEVYAHVLSMLQKRIQSVQQETVKIRKSFENRLKQINLIEKQIIEEGKTPQEGSPVSSTAQHKIILRIYAKYVRIIEFYAQAKDKTQVRLAKKQFQEVLRVLDQISLIQNIEIDEENPQFGTDSHKIRNRLQRIKQQKSEEIYNSGKYNYHVLEWAVSEVIKEQRQARQEQQKREMAPASGDKPNKSIEKFKMKFANVAPFALIIVPVAGALINYFVM